MVVSGNVSGGLPRFASFLNCLMCSLLLTAVVSSCLVGDNIHVRSLSTSMLFEHRLYITHPIADLFFCFAFYTPHCNG